MNVTVNGKPDTVVLFANRVVPDGQTLWFYDGQRLIGSLRSREIRSMFRDSADAHSGDSLPLLSS